MLYKLYFCSYALLLFVGVYFYNMQCLSGLLTILTNIIADIDTDTCWWKYWQSMIVLQKLSAILFAVVTCTYNFIPWHFLVVSKDGRCRPVHWLRGYEH